LITSAAPPGQLRPGAGQRLAAFAELVANATVNAQARGERRAIAAEQAALRRVATLVGRRRRGRRFRTDWQGSSMQLHSARPDYEQTIGIGK
jgi:hypothetical protein